MKNERRNPLLSITLVTLMLLTSAPALAAPGNGVRPARGLVVTESDRSFNETWDVLISALESNPAIQIIHEIDHAAAAATVGLDLAPNRVVFFGNPNLGTPIMVEGRTAGIDLPQKIQVFAKDGKVFVAYNSVAFLADRHNASGAPTLATIANALATLSGAATDTLVEDRTPGTERYRSQDGLVTLESDFTVDTTWARLLEAIGESPASVAFTVDHQANAASVGLDLLPTRLVVFGNPNVGTPLMQSAPTIGIDLPLKMLVWEDVNGKVLVTYNSTDLLAKRHFLDKRQGVLAIVDGLLQTLSNAAIHD